MNPFENIPDELLYQMCEDWSNSELVNMSEAYSHVYQICHKILEKRQADQIKHENEETQKFIDYLLSNPEKTRDFVSNIIISDYKLFVDIRIFVEQPINKLIIFQRIYNPILSEQNHELFLSLAKQVLKIKINSKIKEFSQLVNARIISLREYRTIEGYIRKYEIRLDDLESIKVLRKHLIGYTEIDSFMLSFWF